MEYEEEICLETPCLPSLLSTNRPLFRHGVKEILPLPKIRCGLLPVPFPMPFPQIPMPFSILFVLFAVAARSSTALLTGEGELKTGWERRTKVALDVATDVVTVLGGVESPNFRKDEGLLD